MRLTALLLPAILAACASSPVPGPVALPPASLLEPCPVPQVTLGVNGDLVRGLRAFELALEKCNIDKAALRAWRKENELSDLRH